MRTGASQLSKKLRTQPPNPQNEKRCLFSSCNKKQENKTREKGAEDKMSQVLQSQETTNPPGYGGTVDNGKEATLKLNCMAPN